MSSERANKYLQATCKTAAIATIGKISKILSIKQLHPT